MAAPCASSTAPAPPAPPPLRGRAAPSSERLGVRLGRHADRLDRAHARHLPPALRGVRHPLRRGRLPRPLRPRLAAPLPPRRSRGGGLAGGRPALGGALR